MQKRGYMGDVKKVLHPAILHAFLDLLFFDIKVFSWPHRKSIEKPFGIVSPLSKKKYTLRMHSTTTTGVFFSLQAS